jgi:hypothetical protein
VNMNIKNGQLVTNGGGTIINIQTSGHHRTDLEQVRLATGDGVSANIAEVSSGVLSQTGCRVIGSELSDGTYSPPLSHRSYMSLIRGNGATVDGNAGSSYRSFSGSQHTAERSDGRSLHSVTWRVAWDPETASGGIRLWNSTDGQEMAAIEPGSGGFRKDTVDLTNSWKSLNSEDMIQVGTKGDGSTAPRIRECEIVFEFSQESSNIGV